MAKALKLAIAVILLITAATSARSVTLYECKGGILVTSPTDY